MGSCEHSRGAEVIATWQRRQAAGPLATWGGRLLAAGFLSACLGACMSPPLLNLGLGLGLAGALLAQAPIHRLPGFWVAMAMSVWMCLSFAVNLPSTKRLAFPGLAYSWPALYVFAFAASDLRIRRYGLGLLGLGGISAAVLAIGQFSIGLDIEQPPFRIAETGERATRAVGWFSHHIRFGIAMSQLAVVALAADACGWSWRWRFLPLMFGMVGAVISGSRGVIAPLAFGLGAVLGGRGGRWVMIGLLSAAGVLGLGLTGILWLQPERAHLALKGEDVRLEVWRTTLCIIKDHPLLGVSPAGFDHAYTQVIESGRSMIENPWALQPGNAHNQYLSLAAYFGLPGLVLFLSWILMVLRDLWRSRGAPGAWPLALGSVGIVMIGGLTEDLANYATSRHGLCLVLALAFGLAASALRTSTSTSAPPFTGARDTTP